jgi:RNA polymerase sigma factor (sigma-70 family)
VGIQEHRVATLGSISLLIAQAKDGDSAALGKLHQRYWPQLVARARQRLRGAPLRNADEEDVAQTAFIAFYESVQRQRLPKLENRHQLLALLSHIVACRAVNEIRQAVTARRGGGQVQTRSSVELLAENQDASPEQEAIVNDCYEFYMRQLPDQLREFAVRHLGGLNSQEIADELGCTRRTVERKMSLLRKHWRQMASDSIEQDVDQLGSVDIWMV